MNKNLFTYKKSGVDINAADKFVKFISNSSTNKKGKKKFRNIGGFGSITSIPKNLRNPKLVACTDGVGTKIEIANELNKFDTIGIDLVAMSVNDLIVQGAKPLFFLDYISINKIDLNKLKSIMKGEHSTLVTVKADESKLVLTKFLYKFSAISLFNNSFTLIILEFVI